MTTPHQFGGHWTDEKLERLRKYLHAYRQIFSKNPRAKQLRTIFVDAFAGTGHRQNTPVDANQTLPLLVDALPIYDEDATAFQQGSARIALETTPPFDHYLFIERKPAYIAELERLRQQFPELAPRITIRQGEANAALQDWCKSTNWQTHRAVVFLDPYGMEVTWATIEALAQTKAIDLWVLFPLGQAVNRILTRSGPPEGGWADRLTTFFGTTEWKEAFYRLNPQMSLFDDEASLKKEATFEQIGAFFLQRLATVFPKVADNPLYLRNRQNVPIYLFCFAAANEVGAPTAVRIARDILKK
ncbi:MAG: three-Cys-motif partner protein TcmP [Candidatus Viridilinea halotolerans]|uniref:Three-Cys-motif partner protein TcmP n=1 Tax=Candidatus Viridilinea halotolerans TaxID=2491704 RepID=A0A426U619_9CHLR|nr:MAG: three-Cys-motif partner protein TcmP [Candidatus Viridilinea halotolerans]